MQRSQFNAFINSPDHIRVDFDALFKCLSAMNNPVTDSDDFDVSHLAEDLVQNIDVLGIGQLDLIVDPGEELRLESGLRGTLSARRDLESAAFHSPDR